jgi:ubiquinone/menaquinone biosynthesis C-methylase UbiE
MGHGHWLHPSSRSASAHGVTIGTPRLYEVFTTVMGLRRRAVLRRLVEASGVRPGDRVLDVGCGPGFFTRLLAEAVGPDGRVVGVDAAPEMIAYASRKASGIRNCRFQVGAAESLPFDPGSFDVVVSSLMLHHLPDDERPVALREMRRVLVPQGRLMVADVRTPGPGHGWRLVMRVAGLSGMMRHAPSLEPLAAAAGFQDIRIGQPSSWLQYVQAIAA